jgi:hypothetical protein
MRGQVRDVNTQTNHQSKPTKFQPASHPSAKQPVSHQPIKPTALPVKVLLPKQKSAPNRLAEREKKPEANVVM